MASVRVNPATNKLFLDFRYQSKRYREYTQLGNTKRNVARLEKLGEKIEMEIQSGTFCYYEHFPESASGKRFAAEALQQQTSQLVTAALITGRPLIGQQASCLPATPIFMDFAEEWFQESKVGWRESHTKNVQNMIKKHYLPCFGEKEVGCVTRADVLKFRSDLTKVPGRNKNSEGLSANRINKIMNPLKQILDEAADRFEFTTPFARIKPLKVPRSDVQPFTLGEVLRVIDTVREDYKNYYIVRFFTGMRTGEIDGLQWKYVDFERRQILVRETVVAGEVEYTKTDSSQRAIQMSEQVYQALKRQYKATSLVSKFVFCNLKGLPLDHNNVTKRIWYPLLARLKLEKRRPYQSRHTAATLWLAAGEAPEWIAMQMGHSNTEMLFKVYSRFVPNLTRRDGSAFERLLEQKLEELEG